MSVSGESLKDLTQDVREYASLTDEGAISYPGDWGRPIHLVTLFVEPHPSPSQPPSWALLSHASPARIART